MRGGGGGGRACASFAVLCAILLPKALPDLIYYPSVHAACSSRPRSACWCGCRSGGSGRGTTRAAPSPACRCVMWWAAAVCCKASAASDKCAVVVRYSDSWLAGNVLI